MLVVALGLTSSPSSAQPARAWTLLEGGLKEGKPDLRTAAAQALGLAAGKDRARVLAESVLSDQDAGVRAAGAEALGQIGLPAAVPALKKALRDQSARSSSRLPAPCSTSRIRRPMRSTTRSSPANADGRLLVASQMEMLKDPQALAKIGFEAGLGFIPFGGLGYKAVKAFTTDKTSPVRAAAAQRLIKRPGPTNRTSPGQRIEGRQVGSAGGRRERTR